MEIDLGKERLAYWKTKPYIAPFEVVIHNTSYDCWISFLGKVFDITELISEYEGKDVIKPLLAMAGKDINHWFDERTGEIQHYVHPLTGALIPYTPHGPVPDVSYNVPNSLWRPIEGLPWWKNEKYMVGLLTKRVRPIRIVNMLTFQEVQINVCAEDTFYRIAERFSVFNRDIESYKWRYLDKAIKMNRTMEENEIPDERDEFTDLGIPQTSHVPCVFIYYTDDLKYYDDVDYGLDIMTIDAPYFLPELEEEEGETDLGCYCRDFEYDG